jgi:hypothetical protein
MRAITVRNPYAWAIATGHKDVENRTRPTSYRGDIAIHSGAAWHKAGSMDRRVIDAWWGGPDNGITRIDAADFAGAWFGRVLAVAELYDCHQADSGCCWSEWGDPEGFHLMLRNVRRLYRPVPAKGVLGLWLLPDDVERAVCEQLPAPAVPL